MSKSKVVVASFILGAGVLCTMSVIQKLIAGFDPFVIKGYFVPIFFGGGAGSLIGYYFYKVRQLNIILSQRVSKLESFLPICLNCKKIRKEGANPMEKDSWEQLESYISKRTETQFSHGICPECLQNKYPDDFQRMLARSNT